MKYVLFVLLFAAMLTSCHANVMNFVYSANGEAPHYSSAIKSGFGAVRVWDPDGSALTDLALINAADSVGEPGRAGTITKYILVAPQLGEAGSALANFDLSHAISLPDTDALAFLGILRTIARAPTHDSSYYQYSCDAEVNIAPTTVTTTSRGYSVSTGIASETTWISTCQVRYYVGAGTLTLADGTAWSESIPLDSSNVSQMISLLSKAIADIEL